MSNGPEYVMYVNLSPSVAKLPLRVPWLKPLMFRNSPWAPILDTVLNIRIPRQLFVKGLKSFVRCLLTLSFFTLVPALKQLLTPSPCTPLHTLISRSNPGLFLKWVFALIGWIYNPCVIRGITSLFLDKRRVHVNCYNSSPKIPHKWFFPLVTPPNRVIVFQL